jgi:hypothetical protein
MKIIQILTFYSIYFVSHHVSAMFIANHQEVFTVYVQQLVRIVRLTSTTEM